MKRVEGSTAEAQMGPEGQEEKPVRLVFRYRQAGAGSEIRQLEVSAPAGSPCQMCGLWLFSKA